MRFWISWVIGCLAFVPTARADATLDQALLKAVSYQYLTPLDSGQVQGLLDQGANPNVPDDIGLTALQWMILAAFDNPPLGETQLGPIRLALAHGGDPNLTDFGSHRTALANAMAFVGDTDGTLRELLMSHGATLSTRNVFGADILHEAIRSANFDAATAFLKVGADPMTVDIHGNTTAMYYARSALTPISLTGASGDFLHSLLDGLSFFDRWRLVNRANSAGTTPLIEATRFDNAPLVKELLKAWANPFARDELGETALDVAEEAGFSDIVTLLGGPATRVKAPEKLHCHSANSLPFDFAKLSQVVTQCDVHSIEELLPLLPKNLRASYALVYASRSLQGASPALPRVVLFGKDAKLVVAVSGDDPSFKRYETLEAIQFDSDAKAFNFYEIEFPPSGAPIISDKNPTLCANCHRSDQLRPNWDTFSFWPGVYGSENGFRHRTEQTLYAQYLANRHKGRYRHLLEESDELVSVRGIAMQDEDSPPVKLGEMFDELNYQAISRELKNDPTLQPFRYALLGALSCDLGEGAIQDFLPASIQATLALPYAGLEDSLFDNEALDNDEHIARQASILPGSPEDFRQREDIRPYRAYYDERQKAQILYLVKGVHPDWPLNWSLVLGSQHFTFNLEDGGFAIFEYDLWRELLDPVQDAALYQAFAARSEQSARDREGSVFYQRPEATPICASLKAASLAQFSR